MAELLKGKPVADSLDEVTLKRADALKEKGITPTLAILRVGERQDDLSYERGATKRCEKDGVAVVNKVLPEDCSQEDLMAAIKELNEDDNVHGILMFRPLPKTLDEKAACNAILPSKDVDGITPGSMAYIYSGLGEGFAPCTSQAVMEILKYYEIDPKGKKATVVGRSLVIGKPVSMLLMNANATVTICHSRTENMAKVTKNADIVIAALGKAEMLNAEYFENGQTVIDVGINYSEEKQKLVGDVKSDEVESVVEKLTPVPGGVGSVTTAVLVSHVVEAAERLLK
ncbi:methylenetetrahydrofolate dehydrogenase (NADP+) / methenyltetrahydrofolate cyclohydrolase [Butyrivibrio fibrisolvens DSM 3071]|uniref:Bifunctional protein FolD n=1 Tax=Butyrivibrio fibrisolvens DSM 3071 TaxID=1121131 RepID=A0A1M6ATU6_BUTFI|nr:bifunctional 5,10-methylenetetrahydrofolate dehydrogenase/5,10-methenyltetrahydrofolate cyclohydrolase [Butyrivibrio fibrisolvens]SHI39633.1 methylenetetrahydrofolate dehydrogenase (NADP+) / methenyltetrahydrofolate cyclohydrolase [Butyrivibrio fibrisolvens DSM 3071]